jgi:glycosyltransferase involved in cell wall biosynthesis
MATGLRVSAVIPVYNCERYLAEAIGSALAQSRPPDEIVVVDDGSTDASADVAASFGAAVRLAREPHGGIGAARNRGVALAGGDLVAFLDSDDLWTRQKLEIQLDALARAPADAMVIGHVEQFASPDLAEEVLRHVVVPPGLLPGYVPGAALIRRSAFERVGPFETCFAVGEFVSWCLRARERGLPEVVIPDVVLRRRIHAANTGIRRRDSTGDYAKILKASLDRRRARSGGGA